MRKSFLNKFFVSLASLSLLFNSLLTPFSIAYAQDATQTPEPTPVETSTPEPTIEPTAAPTEEPSPTPVEIIALEVTPTPVATDGATPNPTPEETIVPTFAPESTPTTTAPPAITPEQPKEDGHISAVVLSDTSAASIPVDDLIVNTDGSATLQTDKVDYAPTDSVLVTGAGFLAGKTYTIIISSSDDPAVTHEGTVTADSEGKIIYSYQLDGTYRPNYSVVAKNANGQVVASTTFTDADKTASVSGNWNSTTTWGGSAVPTSADDVIINPGITVTVTADAAAKSITFANSGTTAGILRVNTGMSLTVTNGITLQNAAGANTSATLTGAGTINAASVTVGGTTTNLSGNATTTLTSTISTLSISGNLNINGEDDVSDDNNTAFALASGSVSVGGTVNTDEENGSTVTLTLNTGAKTGTLTLSGSTPFTNIVGSPTFDANGTGATVVYSRTGAQTVRAVTYRNLTLSGSGTKTLTSLKTVNGNLTLSGAATATTADDLSIGGNLDVGSGTTFTVAGFNIDVTGNTNISGTLTVNSTSGTKTFDNIIINTGGLFNSTVNKTYSLTGNLQVDGTGSITSGTGAWTFSGTGTLSGTGSATITNADFITSYSNSGTFSFSDLYVQGSGIVNLTNNGTITVTSTLTGNDNFVQGATGILNFGGSSIANTGFTASAGGNTVNYNAAGVQTVRAVTYSNLTLSGSGAKSMATGTSVGGNLSIVPTGTATASIAAGQNLSVGSLTLGGLGRINGTWGSTTATAATNKNDTYFAATTGYLTVTNDTRTTPTITTLPTSSGIIYGQALSASTLSGGSASTTGSFAFTTPATTPPTGNYSAPVTFTPTDLTSYKTATGNVNVTVAKANSNVTTWPTASSITYGQTLASSTLTGGSSTPTGSFAFTTPSTAPDAGTASQGVTFTPTDTTNYNSTTGTVSVTVTKADATITVTPYDVTYDGNAHTATYTAKGVKSEDLAGMDVGGTTHTAAGDYTTDAWTLTDVTGNYTNSAGTVHDVINKKSASVTPDTNTKVYGSVDPTLSGTLDGFLTSDGVTADYTRAAGETVLGSPYTISATLNPAGILGNYDITYNTANFSITAKPITVTADAKSKVFGDSDPTFTYVSSDLGVTFTGSLSRVAGENVGTYAIGQNDLSAGTNYTVSYVGANLTIGKSTLNAKADDKSKEANTADPIFTITYTGFKFSDTASVLDTAPVASVSVTHDAVGSYPITVSGGSDNNYDFTYTAGTLTVSDTIAPTTIDNIPPAWQTTPFDIIFTCTDSGSDCSKVYYTTDDSDPTTGSSYVDAASLWKFNVSSDGTYTIKYRGQDVSGNLEAVKTAVNQLKIDQVKPTVISVDSDPKTFNITDMPSKTIKITFSEDIANTPTIGVNGPAIIPQTVNACGDADAKTFCFDYTIPAAQEAPNTIHISDAQDAAGNTMDQDSNHTFKMDTISPSVVLTDNHADNIVKDGDTVTITATFTEGNAIDEVTPPTITIHSVIPLVDNGSMTKVSNLVWTYSWDVPAGNDGTHNVTISAHDTAGNANSNATGKISYVLDNTAPVITLNGSTPVSVVYGTGYTDESATASDTHDGPVSITTSGDTVTTASLVGTYHIYYDTVDASGNKATQVVRTINVTPKPITVTVNASDKVYDGNTTEPSFTLDVTGVVVPDVVSATGGSAAFDGLNVGAHTVTASGYTLNGAQATNYSIANATATALASITPATVNVTASDGTMVYGGTVPTITAAYSPVIIPVTPATCTTDATNTSSVSSYASNCSGAADPNYTFTYTAGSVSVTHATLTITANSASKTYGNTMTPLGTEFVTSGLVGTDSVNSVTLTSSGYVAGATVGSYDIIPSAAVGTGLSNYTIAYVGANLTITKANQAITITTPAPGSAVYNTSFSVAATGGESGNPVTFSSAGSCSNVGATFTMTSGSGTCTVNYDQTGDSNYNAATQVTETVTADKADQTISFGALANKKYGDAPFAVSATTTSGLPITYSIVSGPATITGDTVTITGVGTVTVRASQSGTSDYNAALSVDQSFEVQDKTAPAIASHTNITAEATGPAGAVVIYTSPTTSDDVDAPGVATCSPLSGTTFSLGSTTVTCNAIDAAGNSATPTTFNAIVQDTTAPTASITSPSADSYLKGTAIITANASDAVGIAKVEFFYASVGTKIGEGTETAPGTYSIDWDTTSPDVGDGPHSLWVEAYDNSGNVTLSDQISVIVDNTLPTVISVDSDGRVYNTESENPTIQVTFDEDISNVPTIGINPIPMEDQAVNDCSDDDATTFCFDYTVPIEQETQHRIYISDAQDAAGNTIIEDSSHTFNVDTVLPTLSPVNIASNNADTSKAKVGDTITLHFFSSEPVKPPTVYIAGQHISEADITNNLPDNGNEWSARYQMANGDPEKVQVNFSIDYVDAVDNAGLQITETDDESYVIFDKTDPTGAWVTPAADSTVYGIVALEVTASDETAGVKDVEFQYKRNIIGAEWQDISTDSESPFTANWDTTGLVLDAYTLKAVITDKAGNFVEITRIVNVAAVVSGENSTTPSESSAIITWTTDRPTKSRVVYDTVSHGSLGAAPNYGYANSTGTSNEDPKVLSHSVTISGLGSGIVYYFRTISEGSPVAVGDERTYKTLSTAGAPAPAPWSGVVAGISTVATIPWIASAYNASPLESTGTPTTEEVKPEENKGVLGEETQVKGTKRTWIWIITIALVAFMGFIYLRKRNKKV